MASRKKGTGKKAPANLSTKGVDTHEARIAALEQRVMELSTAVDSAAQITTVVFDLDTAANTAKFARLYLLGHDDDLVNNLDKTHAELPGQTVGSTIRLVMEVRGDTGQMGAFKVTSATPTSLTLSVSKGPKSPKTLFVAGDA